jgi:hypothetical protein
MNTTALTTAGTIATYPTTYMDDEVWMRTELNAICAALGIAIELDTDTDNEDDWNPGAIPMAVHMIDCKLGGRDLRLDRNTEGDLVAVAAY